MKTALSAIAGLARTGTARVGRMASSRHDSAAVGGGQCDERTLPTRERSANDLDERSAPSPAQKPMRPGQAADVTVGLRSSTIHARAPRLRMFERQGSINRFGRLQ